MGRLPPGPNGQFLYDFGSILGSFGPVGPFGTLLGLFWALLALYFNIRRHIWADSWYLRQQIGLKWLLDASNSLKTLKKVPTMGLQWPLTGPVGAL